MKKMTYDEYERFCIEKREQFYEEFDEFIDMENPADLKFNIDFGEIYSIAAVNKDADVVAAFCQMMTIFFMPPLCPRL